MHCMLLKKIVRSFSETDEEEHSYVCRSEPGTEDAQQSCIEVISHGRTKKYSTKDNTDVAFVHITENVTDSPSEVKQIVSCQAGYCQWYKSKYHTSCTHESITLEKIKKENNDESPVLHVEDKQKATDNNNKVNKVNILRYLKGELPIWF